MIVHIQSKRGIPAGVNSYVAYLGFLEMGFEVDFFEGFRDWSNDEPENIVVGGLGSVRHKLRDLDIPINEINYPSELNSYLGRKLWTSTINHVNSEVDSWPVFVKPIEGKRFTGKAVYGTADLVGCGCSGEDFPVLCSEVVRFVSEYRCFVRYGQILDVRRYRGDWSIAPDRKVIEQAVRDYASAPAGYGIDFGVTDSGETLLVEVNEGYSLGSYGLQHNLYAQLLSARWAELTGTEDWCNFGIEIPDSL